MQSNDKTLVEEAKTDSQAFGVLYDQYIDKIYGYVLRQTQDGATAEDITAVTFEKALRHIQKYEWRDKSFAAWLYRIAHNEIIQHHRKRRFLVPFQATQNGRYHQTNGRTPETAVLHQQRNQTLHQAIDQLSNKDKEVVTLRYFTELSNDEIAEVLGCSTSNVYLRLHRALKRLRQKIDKLEANSKEINYVS